MTVFVSNIAMNCPDCDCPANTEADYQEALIAATCVIIIETSEWVW